MSLRLIILSLCLLAFTVSAGMAPAAPSASSAPDPAACKEALLDHFGQEKINTRHKPRILRYEDVDAHLAAILRWAESRDPAWVPAAEAAPGDVILRFDEVFTPGKTPCFLPLTNNIVKQVPTASLQGLAVYEPSGDVLGTFAGTYEYTRTGVRAYTLICFQYERPDGRMQRSGTDLLLDRFVVSWEDVHDRPFLILRPQEQVPNDTGR